MVLNATEKIFQPAGPSVIRFLDLKSGQQSEFRPSAFIRDGVQPDDYPVTTSDDFQSEMLSTEMSLLYKATINIVFALFGLWVCFGQSPVGLGPDNFLSVCTSVRRKNLVQNGLSGRPFFIGSSRCGLSVQPDNPFATFSPLK